MGRTKRKNNKLVIQAGRKGTVIGQSFRPEHFERKRTESELLSAELKKLTSRMLFEDSVTRKVRQSFGKKNKVTRFAEAKLLRTMANYAETEWKLKQLEIGAIEAEMRKADKLETLIHWMELSEKRKELLKERQGLASQYQSFKEGAERRRRSRNHPPQSI